MGGEDAVDHRTATGMIDHELLRSVSVTEFQAREPFPWLNLTSFLTPDAFAELHATFPPRERFEWHADRTRRYGQRPHNRYYLELEGRRPATPEGAGVIRSRELSLPWQRLVDELETSREYRERVCALLQVDGWTTTRYAWHVGIAGSEVSPHADSPVKLGTHILYFNTGADWRPEWGGATLLLGGRMADRLNPDFGDFTTAIEMETTDNRSLFFKNSPEAWHGVRTLRCPAGRYRRLFNVIFERRRPPKTVWSRIRQALPLARGRGAGPP